MKFVNATLISCLVLSSAVMIYLVIDGAAMRSAGLIKPTVLDSNNKLLPKSVALRLFPDFQTSPNTIWQASPFLQNQAAAIVGSIHDYYKTLKAPSFPEMIIVNSNTLAQETVSSVSSKWWVFESANETVLNRVRQSDALTNIIYLTEFKRDEVVPPNCEIEKVLSRDCLKVIAIREVKKKFKTNQRYFFMRRYNEHEFYLFIEQ